jgi:hypothetical protein
MAKIHPLLNPQFVKAIRGVHSLFQEESLKIKSNHCILPYAAILECICAALKISKNMEECTRNLRPLIRQVRKVYSFHQVL